MERAHRRHGMVFAKVAGLGLLLVGLFVVFAGQALASGPSGEYATYSDCPYENVSVSQCNYIETTGGEVKIGSTRVPIAQTLLIQGGSSLNFETGQELFYAARDGVTLSKTPEPVEGGLFGVMPKAKFPPLLLRVYEILFKKRLFEVNAVTELAKPASEIGIDASNFVGGEGAAFVLPIKIRLENPLLGSTCYIGSDSTPIYLNMTAGTTSPSPPNTPITGFPGTFAFAAEGAILNDTGYKLLDNNFAVPQATGCGGPLSAIVDPILNTKIGLPSAAGNNTAIFTGNLKRAYAPAVHASIK
jgi:hypothetical protein